MSEVTIEKATGFEDAQRLYSRAIPSGKTSKFDWLYAQNPAGKADVYHARDTSSNEVVGVYAIYPMKFSWYGSVIDVGQAFDAVVLPEYRGQGVFNRFLEFSSKDIQNKYKFMIGFPNHLSRGVLYRAGWLNIGDLETYSLPLSGAAFGKKAGSGPLSKLLSSLLSLPTGAYRSFHLNRIDSRQVTAQPMNNCPEDIARITKSIQNRNPVSAARTPAFVNWRMLTAPVPNYVSFKLEKDGDLIGYAVIRRSNNSGELVDLVVTPKLAAPALKVLVLECVSKGLETLHFQVSTHSYMASAIQKLGARKRKEVAPVIFYPLLFSADQVKYEDWFLTHADTDWV